jgi:hypothetical protein
VSEMQGCPVCNGFYPLVLTCSCGGKLEDMGRVENFADAYSPYHDFQEDQFPKGDPFKNRDQICVHLLTCPACKKDERIAITTEKI